MELDIEIDPRSAREICLHVLRSPNSEEYTAIKFYRGGLMQRNRKGQQYTEDSLVLDTPRSSLLTDVAARPPEIAPLHLPESEALKLRVFIDRGVVEVFANDRLCVALRVYPSLEESLGVSIRAQGADATLRSLDAWQMAAI